MGGKIGRDLHLLSRMCRAIMALIALLMTSPVGAQTTEPRVTIPGTTVSLVPPKDFSLAPSFSGLWNPVTGASVLIAEFPAEAHAQMVRLWDDAAKPTFAARGIDVQTLGQVDIAGQMAPLITATQTADNVAFNKWMVLLKGSRTVMITVQSPTGKAPDSDQVRAMLASISLGDKPTLEEQLQALPFSIKAAAPFRIVKVSLGMTLSMTVGPLDTDPTKRQPLLIATRAPLDTDLSMQPDALAEMILRGTQHFASATITTRQKMTIAGDNGVFLTGTYREQNVDKSFEQYFVVVKPGQTFQVIVMADGKSLTNLKPAITSIINSVTFKNPSETQRKAAPSSAAP